MIRIELFGVPRLRAGCGELEVQACTLGEALIALAEDLPALSPDVVDGGRLGSAYALAINGLQFARDPNIPLRDGDVLMLMAAQVGG